MQETTTPQGHRSLGGTRALVVRKGAWEEAGLRVRPQERQRFRAGQLCHLLSGQWLVGKVALGSWWHW